ncbi:MAG: metalloregulator ArsR/SmtB family transcription factor [Firmicutes bacterium]|nr:metalloregulator ArsR/SmtB family transcription factor [Bacillota bacterium]
MSKANSYGHGEYAFIFKTMSDETRLKILSMLTQGTTCACKILEAFNFTQPTLSYHMKQLTDSGLVDAEKRGKWVYYSLNVERVEIATAYMCSLQSIGSTVGECHA